MELSAYIRKHALSIPGKLQLIMTAFAKALEIIPRQICDNAGLDSTDILNKLRMKHANGEIWFGVDVDGVSGVRNNMDAFVWEPSLVKTNAISSAAEAACLILSVDETVRNPQSEAVRVIAGKTFTQGLTLIILAKCRAQSTSRDRATRPERTWTWTVKRHNYKHCKSTYIISSRKIELLPTKVIFTLILAMFSNCVIRSFYNTMASRCTLDLLSLCRTPTNHIKCYELRFQCFLDCLSHLPGLPASQEYQKNQTRFRLIMRRVD